MEYNKIFVKTIKFLEFPEGIISLFHKFKQVKIKEKVLH